MLRLRNIIKRLYYKILPTAAYVQKLGVKFGKDCVFNCDPGMAFGSEPWLITMGDHVLLSKGCCLLTHDGAGWLAMYDTEKPCRMDSWGKIEIGNNVYIGTNAIIMPNVKIGNNVIVAAGAIVTKNAIEDGVYVGCPAHRIKSFSEWYESSKFKMHDTYGMTNEERRNYFDRLLSER